MIPKKIQIKNFLSYGSDLQEINFEPYNLICLSGKNGHGKSALLDAITWSIWGQARKTLNTSKPDEGLLRIGQRQMIVIFDFYFGEQEYRIRREFTSAYSKSYSYLDFGLIDKDNQENIISLTGKSIRETQSKINQVLGLDYDSFINSAFLRQGNSNEFSKKSAKERKEILCSILGLDKFENLKKCAQEKVREFAQKKETIERLQERIETELKEKDAFLDQEQNLNKEIESIQNEEKSIDKKTEFITNELNKIHEINNEIKILNFKLNDLENKSSDFIKNGTEAYKEWKLIHKKTIQIKDKKNLEDEKTYLEKELKKLQEKAKKRLELKEEFLNLKNQEFKIKNDSDSKYQKLTSEKKLIIESLKIKIENIAELENKIKKEVEEKKEELKSLSSFLENNKEIDIEKEELNFEKRKEFYHYLVNSGNYAKNQLQDLSKKREISLEEENPSCPLCLQNLSNSRKRFLKEQMDNSENIFKNKILRSKKILPEIKKLLINLDTKIKSIKEINKQVSENTKRLADTKKEITELTEKDLVILKNKNQLEKELQLIEKEYNKLYNESKEALNNNKDYQQISLKLKSIPEDLKKLESISSQINETEIKLNNCNKDLDFLNNLNHQQEKKQEKKNLVSQINSSLKDIKIELEKVKLELENLKKITIKEEELTKEISILKNSKSKIYEYKDKLIQQKGNLEAKIEKIKKLEKEHKENHKNLNLVQKEIQDYKDIAQAYSKDGIQALLIEEAIPEIENEANNILAKLTDNQSQVFIESLKDLKKGGTKETLDIKVSDSIGLRDYEMFSGGEAFRIDFALRIAISKLLAQRSGASLQTLIIDEGFGSQDEEGLSNIMDSIYKIQDEFQKVVIVSHLTSMKDQFPVHFNVKKIATGSIIEVMEQG